MHPKTKQISWSSDFAYAVGLITTDGNLSPDGRHFDFTSNDIDLIETFKNCMNIKNKISRKKSTYTNKYSAFRIQFGNITLYKFLLGIGLMPNKSKRLQSLKIPDEFFFDFLRGHLDGDGSIKKYYDPVYKNSKRLYVEFLSASLPHIVWLRKRIKKSLNINRVKLMHIDLLETNITLQKKYLTCASKTYHIEWLFFLKHYILFLVRLLCSYLYNTF